MQHRIWAVVKDPGGTAGILPVVDELEKDGISVLLIANGKAVELLQNERRAHMAVSSVDSLFGEVEGFPDVLITSMCTQGGVGRDLVPLLRKGKIPTIAFQDLWGNQLRNDWEDPSYRPDYIVTNDEVGKKVIQDNWPDFNGDHVWITGFPALDKYSSFDVEGANTKVRRALGLEADIPIVLFGGQGQETAHALGEVVAALNYLNIGCYLLPRPHPRTKDNFKEEMTPWQGALADFRGRHVVDYFGQCIPQELVAAAASNGVVVSMYSTILLEAAALRGNALSILYPNHGYRDMRENYAAVKQFPLNELGGAAHATNREEVQAALTRALMEGLGLRAAQEEHVRVDGQNARRAANNIKELL